jgi:hypothetical protein
MAASDLSAGARIAIGALLAIAGAGAFAMGCAAAWRGIPFSDERWIGLPLGVALASFGSLLALPVSARRARGILAALLVTGFALAFDWIAFGPG